MPHHCSSQFPFLFSSQEPQSKNRLICTGGKPPREERKRISTEGERNPIRAANHNPTSRGQQSRWLASSYSFTVGPLTWVSQVFLTECTGVLSLPLIRREKRNMGEKPFVPSQFPVRANESRHSSIPDSSFVQL